MSLIDKISGWLFEQADVRDHIASSFSETIYDDSGTPRGWHFGGFDRFGQFLEVLGVALDVARHPIEYYKAICNR